MSQVYSGVQLRCGTLMKEERGFVNIAISQRSSGTNDTSFESLYKGLLESGGKWHPSESCPGPLIEKAPVILRLVWILPM